MPAHSVRIADFPLPLTADGTTLALSCPCLLGIYFCHNLARYFRSGFYSLYIIANHPSEQAIALCIAGLFNGLGSVVSYFMGRYLPLKKRPSEKIAGILNRYGIWSLLFAWLPVLRDGLPIAAGWLRLNAWKSCLILIVGKFIRYAALLAGMKLCP